MHRRAPADAIAISLIARSPGCTTRSPRSPTRSRVAGRLVIQRSKESQKRPPKLHAVVRRDPPGLGLEKSEGNLIGFMCEDARGCVRIYFGTFVDRRNIVIIQLVTICEFAFVNRRSPVQTGPAARHPPKARSGAAPRLPAFFEHDGDAFELRQVQPSIGPIRRAMLADKQQTSRLGRRRQHFAQANRRDARLVP